jgi:hypothetical protein
VKALRPGLHLLVALRMGDHQPEAFFSQPQRKL